MYTDNFNSTVTLKAGNDIGAGNPSPFIIEGFNGRITKKVLNAHGGTAGNNLLTVTAGGDSTIVRNATTDLSLQASTSVGAFLLKTNSKLTVAGNVSATGTSGGTGVTLQNTGGAFIVNPNVQITAYDSLELTNGSKKKPTMTLGANSTYTTTAVGAPGVAPIFFTVDRKAFAINHASVASAGKRVIPPPTVAGITDYPLDTLDNINLTVGGTTPEQARGAGRKGNIQFLGPVNSVNSNNATVVLQNSGSRGALSFNGGVTVTAGQP